MPSKSLLRLINGQTIKNSRYERVSDTRDFTRGYLTINSPHNNKIRVSDQHETFHFDPQVSYSLSRQHRWELCEKFVAGAEQNIFEASSNKDPNCASNAAPLPYQLKCYQIYGSSHDQLVHFQDSLSKEIYTRFDVDDLDNDDDKDEEEEDKSEHEDDEGEHSDAKNEKDIDRIAPINSFKPAKWMVGGFNIRSKLKSLENVTPANQPDDHNNHQSTPNTSKRSKGICQRKSVRVNKRSNNFYDQKRQEKQQKKSHSNDNDQSSGTADSQSADQSRENLVVMETHSYSQNNSLESGKGGSFSLNDSSYGNNRVLSVSERKIRKSLAQSRAFNNWNIGVALSDKNESDDSWQNDDDILMDSFQYNDSDCEDQQRFWSLQDLIVNEKINDSHAPKSKKPNSPFNSREYINYMKWRQMFDEQNSRVSEFDENEAQEIEENNRLNAQSEARMLKIMTEWKPLPELLINFDPANHAFILEQLQSLPIPNVIELIRSESDEKVAQPPPIKHFGYILIKEIQQNTDSLSLTVIFNQRVDNSAASEQPLQMTATEIQQLQNDLLDRTAPFGNLEEMCNHLVNWLEINNCVEENGMEWRHNEMQAIPTFILQQNRIKPHKFEPIKNECNGLPVEFQFVDVFKLHSEWNQLPDEAEHLFASVLKTNSQNHAAEHGEDDDEFELISYCEICCEYFGKESSSQLITLPGCQHTFCDSCLANHLLVLIHCHNQTQPITCPHHECDSGRSLPISLLLRLISWQNAYRFRAAQLANHIVSVDSIKTAMSSQICECMSCKKLLVPSTYLMSRPAALTCLHQPHAGRNKPSHIQQMASQMSLMKSAPITTGKSVVVTFQCGCGVERCPFCLSSPGHFPASCTTKRHYEAQKCVLGDNLLRPINEDEINRLKLYGQFCPRCGNFITKNGGCNHMTCTCHTHFCYICGDENGGVVGRHRNYRNFPCLVNSISSKKRLVKKKFEGSCSMPEAGPSRSRVYCQALKFDLKSRPEFLRRQVAMFTAAHRVNKVQQSAIRGFLMENHVFICRLVNEHRDLAAQLSNLNAILWRRLQNENCDSTQSLDTEKKLERKKRKQEIDLIKKRIVLFTYKFNMIEDLVLNLKKACCYKYRVNQNKVNTKRIRCQNQDKLNYEEYLIKKMIRIKDKFALEDGDSLPGQLEN